MLSCPSLAAIRTVTSPLFQPFAFGFGRGTSAEAGVMASVAGRVRSDTARDAITSQ
jgi:hypothetical protein